MQKITNRLVIAKDDYEIIMSHIKGGVRTITFNRRDAEELESELKKAKLVDKEKLPADVVRLDSKVIFCFYSKEHDPLVTLQSLSRKAIHWKTRVDIHKHRGNASLEAEYVL